MKLTHLLGCTRYFSTRCWKAIAKAGILMAFPFLAQTQQTYTLKIDGGPLESAIIQVRNYTGDAIAYNKSDINSLNVASAQYKNMNTGQLLNEIISGLPLHLKKEGNIWVLIKNDTQEKPKNKSTALPKSLGKISGKVVDEKGNPMVGVTINIGNITTTTDENGNYSINVPAGTYPGMASYVGYITKEFKTISIKENENLSFNINLDPAHGGLDEIVVTALGVKRAERNLGYAVTQLKSEEVSTNKTINIQSALIGKVAGVDIGEPANGIAGSKRVQIRGISTISTSGNSSPLWVIDGVPVNSTNFGRNSDAGGGIDYGDGLSMINPDNIETISVLKGNAAAALYGSRASNGVILITTKNGKSSRKDLVVELNSSLTNSSVVDMTNWQYEYGQGRDGKRPVNQQEALVTGGSSWGEKLDGKPTVQFDGVERPYSAQRNNPSNFYSDAVLYSNTLSISKSTDRHNYRLSVGQTDSKDFVRSGSYRKRNASLNASTMFGKFTASVNAMYMVENVKNRQNIGGNVHNAHYTLIQLPTNLDVLDLKPGYLEDGTEKIFTDGAITNPYFVIDRMYEEDTKNRLVNSLTLKYDIANGLYAQGRVMQDYFFFKRFNYQPEGMNWQPFGGEYDQRWSDYLEMNYEATAGYDKFLKGDFNLNLMVGANVMKRSSSSVDMNGTPFVIPGIYTLNNTITKTVSTGKSESQVNSLFGMAELAYKKYLFLTLTGRQDWFSTLPINNNNLFYPSASLSFVLTDAFNIRSNILEYAKLRSSFAQVSGGADPYGLDLSYGLDSKNYNEQVLQGIVTTTIPNKNLKPLISSEAEVGMELQLFNGFLYLDAAYYSKKVKDDIVSVNVPNSSGYNRALLNTGNVNNSGFELMAEFKPLRKKLKWSSRIIFSKNYNKVMSLGNIESIQIGAAKNDVVTVNIEKGLPYGVIKGSVYKRDDQGNIVFDKDGYAVVGDRSAVLGNGFHDRIAGFTNRFSYGNYSLSFHIDGKFGGKLYSQTNRWAVSAGKHLMTLEGREDGIIGKGVSEDGKGNDVLVPPTSLSSYYNRLTTIHETFIYDASFIKFRELALSWNIPKKIINTPVISNASVSLVARNLFYLMKKVDNVSPESSVSSSNVQGLENSGYPETRTIGFNLNLTF